MKPWPPHTTWAHPNCWKPCPSFEVLVIALDALLFRLARDVLLHAGTHRRGSCAGQ